MVKRFVLFFGMVALMIGLHLGPLYAMEEASRSSEVVSSVGECFDGIPPFSFAPDMSEVSEVKRVRAFDDFNKSIPDPCLLQTEEENGDWIRDAENRSNEVHLHDLFYYRLVQGIPPFSFMSDTSEVSEAKCVHAFDDFNKSIPDPCLLGEESENTEDWIRGVENRSDEAHFQDLLECRLMHCPGQSLAEYLTDLNWICSLIRIQDDFLLRASCLHLFAKEWNLWSRRLAECCGGSTPRNRIHGGIAITKEEKEGWKSLSDSMYRAIDSFFVAHVGEAACIPKDALNFCRHLKNKNAYITKLHRFMELYNSVVLTHRRFDQYRADMEVFRVHVVEFLLRNPKLRGLFMPWRFCKSMEKLFHNQIFEYSKKVGFPKLLPNDSASWLCLLRAIEKDVHSHYKTVVFPYLKKIYDKALKLLTQAVRQHKGKVIKRDYLRAFTTRFRNEFFNEESLLKEGELFKKNKRKRKIDVTKYEENLARWKLSFFENYCFLKPLAPWGYKVKFK